MTKHLRVSGFDPMEDVRLYDENNLGDDEIYERELCVGVGENFQWPTVHKWTGTIMDMFEPGGPLYPYYEPNKMEGRWLLSGMTIPQAQAT